MLLLPWVLLCFSLLPTNGALHPASDHESREAAASSKKLISSDTEKYAQTLLKRWNSKGLAVAVVQKDPKSASGWRYETAGYGIARDDGSKVTENTQFGIASNSKLFLAVSLGLLISNKTLAEERGSELSWTTKARDIIPGWGLWDETMDKGVTLGDMLAHRTGMPRHDFSGYQREGGVQEVISTLRHLRPSAEWRETFQYNNLIYEALSILPSVLLNQTYESYVAQHIFKPLNMASTTFSVAEIDKRPTMAHGYLWDDRDIFKQRNGTLRAVVPYFVRPGEEKTWAGPGGIISSAKDLTTWVATLLNGGVNPYTGVSVIPPEVISYVGYGRSINGGAPYYEEFSAKTYGAGAWRFSYQGHDLIEHGGNNFGFRTQVARFPNDNLGIIVLSNDGDGFFLVEAVKFRIADELLGLKKIAWNDRFEQEWQGIVGGAAGFTSPRPNSPTPPSKSFSALASQTYNHPTYGTLQPCLVPLTVGNQTGTDPVHPACPKLLSSFAVKRILGATNVSIPTFIVPWKKTFSTHLLLTHHTENLFNLTVIWNNAELREREGFGAQGSNKGDILFGLNEHFVAEFLDDGMAWKGGIWGLEGDGRAPTGTGKDSAEVWFQKS